ncbi:hypothetical protein ACIPL1_24870 [Pseudomonas sp. NPDC090202]|uniref:hypothetical protein n=1 Tax=Pseudomonas sp. NPDC090202 TaxID=3364476 RepID=UPI0038081F42
MDLSKPAMAGLALALTAAVSLSAFAGSFSDKTDRFTGSRSVIWSSIPDKPDSFAMSTYAFYVKGDPKPGLYKLSLITWGDRWQFLNCHHSNWLVDGKPAPQLEFEYKSEMAGSATSERFDLYPNRALLQQIANAKLFEYSLCGTEGRVSDADLDGIRRVLEASK